MSRIRRHWRSISTGMLLASLVGVGAFALQRYLQDDCCYPGAACCHPGAACCKGHSGANASVAAR